MKFINNSNDLSFYLEENVVRDIPIKNISIDSRSIKKESLFIAIKGNNFNGNNFVKEAFKKGASIALVDDQKFIGSEDSKIVYVKNTIRALKKISKNIIKNYDGDIIAVTGSNGKTSTTNIISNVLSNCSSTIGNFNNEIGMPLSLINSSPKSNEIVLEIGASEIGDINYLSKILCPSVGVITNIGSSHLEKLKNIDGVLKVKSELVDNIKRDGNLIVPNENEEHLNFWKNLRQDINVFTFGMKKNADFFPTHIKKRKNGNHFKISSKFFNKNIQIKTSLEGEHNIKNILASFAVYYCLGKETDNFALEFESKDIKDIRQKKSKWLNGCTLIDDTYNANPDSVKNSIDLLSNYKKNTVLVLGDMLELGKHKKRLHKEVGKYAKEKGIKALIGYGKLAEEMVKGYGERGFFFENEKDLKSYLKKNITSKDVILIKGSRGMKMERFKNV
jgi:UDP-N-acetylmuramoyl-tripeptide--D-alanyl-D-alanine ligase|tara:strand:+ start:5956 stop:7296 length:1341 start_codon:yes stop_codon:yes gene_type:complete